MLLLNIPFFTDTNVDMFSVVMVFVVARNKKNYLHQALKKIIKKLNILKCCNSVRKKPCSSSCQKKNKINQFSLPHLTTKIPPN